VPVIAEDAQRLARRLFAAYPEVPLREGTEATYVELLGELDAGAADAAIADLLRTSSRLPAIADVRRRLAETELGLPSPLEAYHSLFDASAELHPLTRYVAEIFGGTYTIRTSDAPAATRRQFLDFYDELRGEAVRRGALPRAVERPARSGDGEAPAEQPSVWTTIRSRFEELPEDEQGRRRSEARRRLLEEREVDPDWLAEPLVEHETLRTFAEERGWLELTAG
jgi:hypothetical protein